VFYTIKKIVCILSVGSAITALSTPENEYEECLLKAKAMRGFAIIEFHNSILNFNLYF
jgi:anthranilate/para-aminobenzoate synthase component I